MPGTRELIVAGTPYIVAYRVTASPVDVLAVIHAARRWPHAFDRGVVLADTARGGHPARNVTTCRLCFENTI